ncbi:MAG: hypothetical protein LBQ38_05670 [Spirochaetaceae bacterium]|nr:hypothetical protein [Spirochaetaceae bacterium]
MKRHLFYALVSALIVLMSLISCKQPVGETGNNNGIVNGDVPNVVVVDISQETDWNYMFIGKDGSSLFLGVNETTGIPTLAYLKPEKDSDIGFTYLFKENGLPDKAISNGHVLYFGNYSGYTFDLAVIYPNDTIEYHYGIETDINFDAYNGITPSPQVRSILSGSFGWSDALGLASCGGMFIPGLQFLAKGCGSYVVGEVISGTITFVTGDAELGGAVSTLIDSFGCMRGTWNSCVAMLAGAADLGFFADLGVAEEKIEQINETIRKIEGDALTTTIPRELLEYFLLLGIEINSGRNPPIIEGTYLATPLQLVKKTTSTGIAEQWDMYVTFSEQNDARLTVDANYTQQSDNGPMSSGGASVITGEGNKFTVFMEGTRVESGYTAKTVEVYSGEITVTGIRNFQWAVFMVNNNGDPLGHWIESGTGYFKRDSDGFSVKTQGQSGRQVIIDMYDSSSDGWDHSGALKISINGIDISSARLNSGSFGSYPFFVSPGDVVNIYWTGNTGNYHGEDSFIVYYANTPPVPAFNTTSWSGSNALVSRLQDSLSNTDLNQLLGSFTVSAAGPSPSIRQSRNMLPSKEILRQ